MTMYVCLKVIHDDLKFYKIDIKNLYFRASTHASKIGGTTAHIREDLRYSIYDLFVGLMLPSGNDAALVLAENFGRLLLIEDSLNDPK